MTEKRLNANRQNAKKSTGPKTPEGKARASMNALKHGLRASSLAVPILENAEDWEVHRDLVVRDLAPAGYLETILSERVAVLLWRLGRVVRYESAVVSQAVKDVGKHDMEAHEDPDKARERADMVVRVRALKPKAHVDGEDAGAILSLVLEALDLDEKEDIEATCPEDHEGETWGDWDGWTRETLEVAVQSLHAQADDENKSSDPWEAAVNTAEVNALVAHDGHESRAAYLDERRHAALLPEGEVMEKVSRYETTLERSLFKTVHELQRLQAARIGGAPLLPPAAVDVDLSA